MRKTKKTLAILAIVSMILTMLPLQVFADTTTSADRLFGQSRIETAIAVADAGWTSATTAIIAPSADANLVDALAAAPLAGQENAPILLSENNSLNASTKAELTKLGVTKAYVVGAISQEVVDQLNAAGINATALKGADRIDTAAAIAAKLTAPAGSFVVGYNALADALSVASYAAANKYAILVANPDGTLAASQQVVGSHAYVIGGPTLVKDVASATRLYGADRFATNNAVIAALTSGFQYDKVYIANGQTGLVDALVASSLAAKSKAAIVLTDNSTVAAAATVNPKLTSSSKTVALGGTAVVSDAVKNLVAYNDGTTPPVTGTAAVTAVSMTATKSVATGQALVDIGTITVNGGAQGANITGINLTRTGLSSDTTISNITIWNGTNRLNVPNILSTGVADINFTNPVTLAANQTVTLAVKANINVNAVAGAQFAFTVNSLKGATGNLLPATSGTMTVTQVSLGTLTVTKSGDAPTGKLDAGTQDQRLAKFDFQAGNEDQLLKQVTFTQENSIGDTDLANLKLYNNGTQVGATATMSNRKVTFTFGNGIAIANGATVRLELRGDVIGGSGRSIDFDINDANDVQSVGQTYGTTIVGTTAAGSSLEVNPGSFIVSKDSTSPAAGTIATVVKDQSFTNISLQAVGEPIQLQKVSVELDVVNASLTDLTNLKLVSDGKIIGQVSSPTFTNNVELVTLTSPITVTPGTPVIIGITADIPSATNAQTDDQYQLGIAAANGSNHSLSGVGNVSGLTVNYDVASAIMGNTMTVGDIHVTATAVAKDNTNLFKGGANSELVSYDLSDNLNENVSISQITIGTVGTGNVANLANMKIVDATTGNVLSNVITTGTTPAAFSFNNPIIIQPGATVRVTLKADVLSSAAVGTFQFNVVGSNISGGSSATTSALGTTVNFPAATSATVFTVSDGGAALTPTVSTNANLDLAVNAARSAKDVKVAAFKLSNAGPEDAIVKSIYLKAAYVNLGAQDVSNIRIVDYKDNTKIYATLSQLPDGGKLIDLATPITIGSSSASHSMDFVVLADISSTAAYAGTLTIDLGDNVVNTTDLKYQSATTGVTSEDKNVSVISGTVATVTETTINVVAASISTQIVTDSVAPYLVYTGSNVAKFTFTNNGSKAVLLNQVELADTMGSIDTKGATIRIYRAATGQELTNGDQSLVAGPNAITLNNTLRLDPGKSESIYVRIGSNVGTLAAGNAVGITLTSAGTQYKDLSGAPAGFSVDDDNVACDVVTFIHN